MTEEERDPAISAAERIAEQIYDAPVEGVVGLAIKAFMVGEGSKGDSLDDRFMDDACALGAFTESSYSSRRVGNGDTWTEVAHLYMP